MWNCSESDSTQFHTAPSQRIFLIFENFYFHDFQNLSDNISKKIGKYFENSKMANTALSPAPRSVILRQVWLRAVWYCAESVLCGAGLGAVWYWAESDSAHCDTARSQQLRFTADPKVSNTARNFAGNNCVFEGLSLPSMRILIFLKLYVYYCNIAQHFLITF